MSDIERRYATLETTITGNKLGGYAAVFNRTTDIGPYLERLAPTAFGSVLTSPTLDVRGLLNHNPDKLFARTPNTLRLSTDSHGLEFEVDLLPDLPVANEARAMVDAGLITGCSFAFVAKQQNWSSQEGRKLRTHTSVGELRDVSLVTYPAYEGTSVSLRSMPQSIDLRTQLVLARARTHRKAG